MTLGVGMDVVCGDHLGVCHGELDTKVAARMVVNSVLRVAALERIDIFEATLGHGVDGANRVLTGKILVFRGWRGLGVTWRTKSRLRIFRLRLVDIATLRFGDLCAP